MVMGSILLYKVERNDANTLVENPGKKAYLKMFQKMARGLKGRNFKAIHRANTHNSQIVSAACHL